MSNLEKAEEIIRKYTKQAKDNNFDYVRVSMRDNEQEKYVATRFKSEEQDALDKLYSKALTVSGFTQDLESCYDSIHGVLCDAMMKLIKDNAKW